MIYDIIYASPTSGSLLMHRRVVSVFHSDQFTPSAVAGYLATFSRQCQALLRRRPTCIRMTRYAISLSQTDLVLAAIVHDPEDTEPFTQAVCESLVSLYYDNLQRFFVGPGRASTDICNSVFLRFYRQYVGGAVLRLLGRAASLRCVERCFVSLGDAGLSRVFGRTVLTPPRPVAGAGRPGERGEYLDPRGASLDSALVLADRISALFEVGADVLPGLGRRGPHPGFLSTVDIRLGPGRRLRAYSLILRTLLVVVYGRGDRGGRGEEALRARRLAVVSEPLRPTAGLAPASARGPALLPGAPPPREVPPDSDPGGAPGPPRRDWEAAERQVLILAQAMGEALDIVSNLR